MYRREIRRLQTDLQTLRARWEKDEAEFRTRHTILGHFPTEGGMPREEVERRLNNLRQIRQERLHARKRAYARKIRDLEHEIRERLGKQ
ncbi:MAG: hypothetical protein ACE5G5_04195 [Candidatus Methylomirabilales bacterium]